ncbi:hypothetical protein [Methyloceanibacter caenitepidi]|uniref:Uncharacterized protein n=1 Tax=Methyloceanibacter caenitepidi TaxID=1384459 RepID=A0A0A8K269_9HYPH|nr:hypothetical protein [Methyloceanibacter caenitepidi]BAQ16094.1 hypothetical protein GL4_0631 [Methyloceanibacter caenitepidi]
MAKIYRFNPENGAYVSEQDAVREDGATITVEAGHPSLTSVPAPEPRKGYERIFHRDRDPQKWTYEENHDGETVYDKQTGARVVLKIGKNRYLKYGPIPDSFTAEKPSGPYDTFDAETGKWVEDAALKRAATVPVSITPRQMLLGLMGNGMITEQEALDAAKTGAVPASVQQIFDALPTSAERVAAEITWAKMSVVERDHPLVLALLLAAEKTEAEGDAFFVACSKL